MVIVDTTVWIDYLRGLRNKETDYFDRELSRQRFGLTDLILCETLQGVGDEKAFTRVLGALRKRYLRLAVRNWLLRRREISGVYVSGDARFARPSTV